MIIQRKGALGDTLFLTPVVREYRKRYPNKALGICSHFHNIFDNSPYVDMKGRNLISSTEETINLDGYYEHRMDKHPTLLYAEKILGDTNLEYKGLELFETEHDRIVVDNWLAQNIDFDKKTVICHLGNTWVKLQDYVIEEIIQVLTQYYNVILVGRGTEYVPKCDGWINLTGDIFNIQRMKHLISKCNLFFGMDSGVSHIASCTPVPQVVCYSFINPEWRRPLNKSNFKAITANCPNQFCVERKKVLDGNEFRGVSCEYQMCSLDIRTSQIFDAIELLMQDFEKVIN